ncbi:MAG: hypothetical protein ACXV4C_09915 [Halobacteriota archaeon]
MKKRAAVVSSSMRVRRHNAFHAFMVIHLKGQRRVYSRAVYGYDSEAGKLTENKHEQQVVAQMLAWRASGLSFRDIAATLNPTGLPTKQSGQCGYDGSEDSAEAGRNVKEARPGTLVNEPSKFTTRYNAYCR